MTGLGFFEYIKLAIFYGSFLCFPALAYALYTIRSASGVGVIVRLVFVVGAIVFAYARFVEPRILLTRYHDVTLERCFAKAGAMRFAVFSDTHNGLFKNAMPLDRIAKAVAAAKPDAVLIPGDFTYYLHPARIQETFQALSTLETPLLAVMGNHDIGYPGPDLSGPLTANLEIIGVEIIDNQSLTLVKGGERVEILGLSDLWGNRQRLDLLLNAAPHPRIVLTHNPATMDVVPYKGVLDLMIAGHTHGGQIYLPYVTCTLFSFACRIERYGFADHRRGLVFVTSGTGMVDLPLRFAVPPRIDVLTVRYTKCEAE